MRPDPGCGQGLAGTWSLGRCGHTPGSTQLSWEGNTAAGLARGQLRAELAGSDGECQAQARTGTGRPQGGHRLGLRPPEGHQACVLISSQSTRKVSWCRGSICARPPRYTLVISGGGPRGLVGKEAVCQGAGARPGAWDTALPQNALLFVFQLGLHAWLLLSKLLSFFRLHPSRFFTNSKCLGSPNWEKIVTT